MRAAVRWAAGREWSVAVAVSGLLAVVMTWPTLLHPRSTIPQDVYDPSLQAWQIAWDGYATLHHPLQVWSANVSFPERDALAFSDSLLGYAPAGWLGSGPVDAVLRYNLLFVFAFALASFGMYALARQLGAAPVAAAVAGVAFAYAPWRFSHAGHLNILSTGGIVLALAMLARGHGFRLGPAGRRPEGVRGRQLWTLAGWLVACWQLTLGFGLGLPFGYVLLGVAVATALSRRLQRADLIGGACFAVIVLLLRRPYLAVLGAHPDARRSVAYLDLFSPPLRGFLTAPTDSWLWGPAARTSASQLSWPAEMTLLPGITLIALAAAGLFLSSWSVRARTLLGCGVAAGVWVAMGTAAPWHGRFGYLILFYLPGFDSSRTPGRLVLWVLLLLCLLAAGLLTRLGMIVRHPGRPLAVLAFAVPLLAVLAEGVNHAPHPAVPVAPVALRQFAAPLLVLPTTELSDQNVMLWSTDGFPAVVNGSSGYNPPAQIELRQQLATFPDPATVQTLRALGVRTVVVLKQDPNAYATALSADPAALGITRRDVGAALVFTL